MDKNISNVISFDRSAAFLHRRAKKNRASNPLDALELMRKAVEKSPDQLDYQMDIAEVYYEMGCSAQSVAALGRVLQNEGAPAECYFGLGLNFWEMGNIGAFQTAMTRYLGEAADGEYRDEALEFMTHVQIAAFLGKPKKRRDMRAVSLAMRAGRLLGEGSSARAERYLSRSVRLNPRDPRARLSHAAALSERGDAAEAAREAGIAAIGLKSPEMLCAAANIFFASGAVVRANRLYLRALKRAGGSVCLSLIETACKLGHYARARSLLRKALVKFPYERQFLHGMAVCLINTGHPAEAALPYWQRIVRADEGDAVAASFLSLAAQNRLPAAPLRFEYEAPQEEAAGWLARLDELSTSSDEALLDTWSEGDSLKQALRWALIGPHAVCAVALYERIPDSEAEAALRDGLMDMALPGAARVAAEAALRARGAPAPYLSLSVRGFESLGGAEERRSFPKYGAEVLWSALHRTHELFEGDSRHLLTLWSLWAFSSTVERLSPADIDGWAAAIACMSLSAAGKSVRAGDISRRFGLSARHVAHRFHRLGRILKREYINETH